MLLLRAFCLCVSVTAVTVRQGSLKGAVLQTRGGRQVHAFLGVPYATPPVGPRRFQKPTPADPWEGERDASTPGNPCLQSNHSSKHEIFGSEDCLYLNIYTHKISSESVSPVLVYIHGGNFKEGSGHIYRPDFLMDKDIVLVTINYRLGVLGFLSLGDKDMAGNNGLKDQRLALRWVKDNIAQFGGDPSSVTLWGEGAGAASVHLHMLSSPSQGLFSRAIVQSGSAFSPWAMQTEAQAQTMGERFAAQLGCNHHVTTDTLDCLQAMPAYILVDIAQGMYEWFLNPAPLFGPTLEPPETEEPFISKDPWQLSCDKPWIAGLNSALGSSKASSFDSAKLIELSDDFEFLGPLALLFRETAENAGYTAFTVKKFYFLDGDIKPDDFEGLGNMYLDSWFLYPAKEALRRHRGTKYFYYLDYKGNSTSAPNTQDVLQFEDLQYFFPLKYHTSADDRMLSEKLVQLWTNFVIYGKPTLDTSEVAWNESSTATEYLHIKNKTFVMEKDLFKERDDFWISLPYRDKFVIEDKTKDKDEL